MPDPITPTAPTPPVERMRLGLALAGGGLAAALFQVGVLARLAEQDLLREVEALSCVAGGAITGALYYLHLKRALEAEGDLDSARLIELVATVEAQLVGLAARDLRACSLAGLGANLRMAGGNYGRTARLGELLDRWLYRPVMAGAPDTPVRLRDLPIAPRGDQSFNPVTDNPGRYCKVPVLILGATTLNTGHGWRFEATRMGEPWPSLQERQTDKRLLLAQGAYDRLGGPFADLPLGQAVAACGARPGLLPPLPLAGLYRDPDPAAAADARLRLQLADGSLHDALGIEPLRAQACSHLVVVDGARQEPDDLACDRSPAGLMARGCAILAERVRTLQLARLQEAEPGRLALIHRQRELEAPEARPLGPVSRGLVISDRAAHEITSYGVQHRVQQLIAQIRTDLDAFSEVESAVLMADGYQIAERALERLARRGEDWAAGPADRHGGWWFAPVRPLLQAPPPALLRRLEIARHRGFKLARLRPRLSLLGATLGCMLLGGAAGLALRPAAAWLTAWSAAPAPLAAVALAGGLALLAAALLGVGLGSAALAGGLRRPLGWAAPLGRLAAALPLWLGARLALLAGRSYLRAGRLATLGIPPPAPPPLPAEVPAQPPAPAARPEKAA
jgi:NTE family protein